MIFRGAFGLFSKKYPKGGPLENFEKKILHNTHMRSHEKFRAKKMIFMGAFGGGLSEKEKIQSGVWCGCSRVAAFNKEGLLRDCNTSRRFVSSSL